MSQSEQPISDCPLRFDQLFGSRSSFSIRDTGSCSGFESCSVPLSRLRRIWKKLPIRVRVFRADQFPIMLLKNLWTVACFRGGQVLITEVLITM
jgi:hypothetical protein